MLESSCFSVLLLGSNLSFVLSGNRRQRKKFFEPSKYSHLGTARINWVITSFVGVGLCVADHSGGSRFKLDELCTSAIWEQFGSLLRANWRSPDGGVGDIGHDVGWSCQVVRNFFSHGCDRSWWIWALEVIWTWLYQVLFTFFIKIEQFSFPMLLEDFSRDEVGLINHLKLRNFEIDSSVHVSRHFSPQNSSNLSCCHSFHCEQINSNEPSIIGPDSDNLATVRLAEPGPREWQQDVKVPRVTMSVWKIINSSLDWSHRWSVLEWAVCNPSRCGWIWAWLGGWRMIFQSIMLGAFWWPCFIGWTVCNKMAIQRGNLDSVSEGRPLLEIVTPYRHNSHNLRVGRWKLVGERIYRKTDSRGNLLYHQSCLWWDLR